MLLFSTAGVAAVEVMSFMRRITVVTVQCCDGNGRQFLACVVDVLFVCLFVFCRKTDPGSK